MNKISITNTEKLAAAIKEAEGRATARTINVEGILNIIDDISKGIPKTKLHGTTIHYDGAEHFPNTYKYRPESTHWKAENVKGKWYVTDIYRDACPNREKNTRVEYSDEAKERIIENASFRWM